MGRLAPNQAGRQCSVVSERLWREDRCGGRAGVKGGQMWREGRYGGRAGMVGGQVWREGRNVWWQGVGACGQESW